jgi:hypothetical protein
LFWKHDTNLTIKSYSLSHIDSVIDCSSANPWRLTCFYGAPETHLRVNSWNLLRSLKNQFSMPWCCTGDFNEITRLAEISGQRVRNDRQMQAFREAIDDCEFLDLGYKGLLFTWCNNRKGAATTWLRLDRFMATNDWLIRFPSAVVHHLDSTESDHKPIWLNTAPVPVQTAKRKLFRFEDMWRTEQGYAETVTKAWVPRVRGPPMLQVQDMIQRCGRELTKWSHVHFGSVTKQLKKKQAELKLAEEESTRGKGHDQVLTLRQEVRTLLCKEEKMWQQRSRALWLKDGDQNTKYFHSRATHRKRRNALIELRDPTGAVINEPNEISIRFVQYYAELFTAVPLEGVDQVLEGIHPSVTAEMNSQLIHPYTESEVSVALKQMAPLKAPGPDGMPPAFYQSYWQLIGKDVVTAVLSSINSGNLLPSINHTYVTLIPKVKNPAQVTEYRPISLCNVIYKLISKILANRLKEVLPTVIAETQSAFVPGRLMTDNVLIAFETLHHMHNQRTGKHGSMALKLDMSKAYDRVEWEFLRQVMIKMGFHSQWVSLLMECITTVSYSLLINGEPRGHITPSRGLRQGDPISPYLFLICAEGLNGLLNKAASNGEIHGVSICRRSPKLTHLFLQMIVCYFAGLPKLNAKSFRTSFKLMRRLQANN